MQVHILEIVTRGPFQQNLFAVALAPLFRHIYILLALQICSRYRLCATEQLFRSTLKHHFAPLATGSRTDIHNVIGLFHDVAVMLHNYYGIALVAQLFQRTYQSVIVALMQTYARLIEYVEHIHQSRAYLRGKPYALALTAAQRG